MIIQKEGKMGPRGGFSGLGQGNRWPQKPLFRRVEKKKGGGNKWNSHNKEKAPPNRYFTLAGEKESRRR